MRPTPTDLLAAARPRAGAGLAAWSPRLAELWRESPAPTARRAPPAAAGPSPAAGPAASAADASLSREELDRLTRALLSLQRGLTGDRRLAGAGYMEEPDLLGAYLLYYWPVSYLQASLALAELEGLRGLAAPAGAAPGKAARPLRALDLGSGPGPLAAALLDSGVPELVLADSSPRALELAAALLGPRASRLETRVLDLEAAAEGRGPDGGLPAGPFDRITLGHALNELWVGRPGPERRALKLGLLERLLGSLAPGGFLFVMEPALLATCRELIALRDGLLERGVRLLGPCPSALPCPALAAGPDRACHSETPWDPPEPVASLAAGAGLDRRSLKSTWFAFGPAGPAGNRLSPGPTTADARDSSPPSAPRVVSEPMLNKAGRLRHLLCSSEGLRPLSAPAGDPRARAAGFGAFLRGDRLELEVAEPREGGGLGFGAETRIAVRLLAPLPAPEASGAPAPARPTERTPRPRSRPAAPERRAPPSGRARRPPR